MEIRKVSDSAIPQCLKDCGCGPEIIERYLAYARKGRIRDQIRVLEKQRRLLMNALHDDQKKVDCIDFILRELEKEGGMRK